LSAFESVFVIFRGDASQQNSRLIKVLHNGNPIADHLGGKIKTYTKDNRFEGVIFQPGEFTLITPDNKERKTGTIELPDPLQITGAWDLSFAPGWGAPENIQFPELISWSDHTEDGI